MDKYRIKPFTTVYLNNHDPNDTSEFKGNKEEGKKRADKLNEEFSDLQEVLYAQNKHKLLIVFQAMDTGGKDGAIKDVFHGVNPQGLRIASFKVPSSEELAHDYLWRIHKHSPGNGEITIFNRSHYEDVLVVRVRNIVPEARWKKRYEHINQFEKLLVDEGTTILKFFLHIGKDEQKVRLEARLADPSKHWKFNVGDLAERKLWDDYMHAYEDAIGMTSTEWAPWYIVPSNKKWYRNLVILSTIVDTLKQLDMKYPENKDDLSKIVIE
jgi:PPK2 family polyphosphate:nucleotide phosphotransferase